MLLNGAHWTSILQGGHPERVNGTTLELIFNVFTQFSLVCAAVLTPVTARTDHTSCSPQAASASTFLLDFLGRRRLHLQPTHRGKPQPSALALLLSA